MRTSVASAVLLALGLADAAAIEPRPAKVDYTGFRGLRVTLDEHTQEVEDKLSELVAHILNPGARVLDVVVDPAKVDAVTDFAASADVIIEDVGALLAEEEHAAPLATRAVPAESWFTAYHSYNDHLQFLRDLQGGFTSNSAIITAGTSVQGRALTGIQIWGSGGRGSKPAIVIHGTVHAREWISTMVCDGPPVRDGDTQKEYFKTADRVLFLSADHRVHRLAASDQVQLRRVCQGTGRQVRLLHHPRRQP